MTAPSPQSLAGSSSYSTKPVSGGGDKNLPLDGLNIAVTRPRDQATYLQQRITQLGGSVILFPLLEINPVVDASKLAEACSRLADFDLVIFISPNAVRYGMAAIHAQQTLPTRIATIGQGSAHDLRELGFKNVIAPQDRFDSEALLALPELQVIQGWKIAIFRGEGGRELLGDTLKARGASVEYVACYQRSKPQLNIAELLNNKLDAITVSSSEALTHLWEIPGHHKIATLALFVPHARIAEKARQLGWQNVHLTASGDDGIVAGILKWAKHR